MIGISLVAMVMMLFGVITNISADPMLEIQPIQPLLSVQTMWQNFQRDYSKFSYMTIQNNLKRKIFTNITNKNVHCLQHKALTNFVTNQTF